VDKARFLEQIATHPCYGDPKHTYSDVEKAIKSRVRHMGFHGYYVDIARIEAEAAERATLARLAGQVRESGLDLTVADIFAASITPVDPSAAAGGAYL
jgi:hypothetical protein